MISGDRKKIDAMELFIAKIKLGKNNRSCATKRCKEGRIAKNI